MKNVIILLVLLLNPLLWAGQDTTGITVVPPSEYLGLIKDKDVQLIDVRTPEEFREGHIPGAKNINFYSEDFIKQTEFLEKEKPLFIYCRSGNRSAKAALLLKEAGFHKIIDLGGGYTSWKKEDL